ncbi:hypothetical protein AX15_005574 [Amanita polypyramis BW_CC]|nr:hypothetical protein AX15_005574 [Amanita polypyramis BW_CC]
MDSCTGSSNWWMHCQELNSHNFPKSIDHRFPLYKKRRRVSSEMKFTAVFAVLTAVAAAVTASVDVGVNTDTINVNTNAHRLANGMTPLPPARRSSRTTHARRGQPSGAPQPPSQCSTGPVQCCNSVHRATNPTVQTLAGLLGAVLPAGDLLVGITCTPLLGSGCSAQTVCCSNNNFNGLISLGCNNIHL